MRGFGFSVDVTNEGKKQYHTLTFDLQIKAHTWFVSWEGYPIIMKTAILYRPRII